MPTKPKRLCTHPGCTNLQNNESNKCDTHNKNKNKNKKNKNFWNGWYTTQRWRRARANFLINNNLCVECLKEKRLTPATIVDHKNAHKGNVELFWDVNNWQALCKKCHDKKTYKENGAFGITGNKSDVYT